MAWTGEAGYAVRMTGFAARERQALADLLATVGPDAPTLCEGWHTSDLVAHLVLREGRPDAAVGILAKPVAGWTRRANALATTTSCTGACAGPPAPRAPPEPPGPPGRPDHAG